MRDGDAGAGIRWPVVVETVALLAVYAMGLLVAWLVWAPLSLLYLVVILASNLLFMAHICPYCRHFEARSCHSGYHHVAQFFPRHEGRTFARQFQRYVAVMYPVWALLPLVGLYGLLGSLDWGLLAALLLFCLCGFVVLPLASRKICAGCANAAECPRGGRRDALVPGQSQN
ncbi:MAG: hypothetical protein EHM56_07735 [Chloroflexi bacterium]|nr:MAG: hypothetical protein EHM56_07735 [Chloroflexota bacterium]